MTGPDNRRQPGERHELCQLSRPVARCGFLELLDPLPVPLPPEGAFAGPLHRPPHLRRGASGRSRWQTSVLAFSKPRRDPAIDLI